MIKTIKQLKYYIKADLYRSYSKANGASLFKAVVFGRGIKFQIWMRLCAYFYSKGLFGRPLFRLSWLFLIRYGIKYGIDISYKTEIGPGLLLPHSGGIVISSNAKIGKNCEISHQVTVGALLRGENRGACPVIGDNVYLGPGSKIFGDITIGNRVAIGANAVVNKNLEDHAVAVGVPARVISHKGTEGITEKTEYETIFSTKA